MSIPSPQPTVLPAVSRPEIELAYRWLDAIYVDASRRSDVIPVTVDVLNCTHAERAEDRTFDDASKRRIVIRDLYGLAAKNEIVRQGVLALYGAVMEIDRLDALRQALQAQWPGVVAAAESSAKAAGVARQAADAARHKAGTVARLDSLLAELAAAKAKATDPEVIEAIDQQIAEATAQREAAVETALADEAAAVAAEAAAGEAQAAAKDAAEQMLDLRARLAELEF